MGKTDTLGLDQVMNEDVNTESPWAKQSVVSQSTLAAQGQGDNDCGRS